MSTRQEVKRQELGSFYAADAKAHWQAGYTHYYMTVDVPEHATYLIQSVERAGWVLEHAGWVWAEKGYVGYGGFGMATAGIIGNYLFGRPKDGASVAPIPARADS